MSPPPFKPYDVLRCIDATRHPEHEERLICTGCYTVQAITAAQELELVGFPGIGWDARRFVLHNQEATAPLTVDGIALNTGDRIELCDAEKIAAELPDDWNTTPEDLEMGLASRARAAWRTVADQRYFEARQVEKMAVIDAEIDPDSPQNALAHKELVLSILRSQGRTIDSMPDAVLFNYRALTSFVEL